ncbi:MAG: DUF2783 domain-containing protein [Gammaproteobacteria bacterium]|nr:DUF2783 domain-containing protein [Gammaproteobacteria bacterium]MBI5615024.1 DUF2783 domain-containing protein [Gammaproteobacteria bacterium]
MITTPNLTDPDGFFAALMALHEGLSDAESRRLDARLVLLLANQIGDPAVLADVLAAARRASAAPELAPGAG